MNTRRRVELLFRAVLAELEANPGFELRVARVLQSPGAEAEPRKSRRRERAVLDPISILKTDGEARLREQLAALDLEKLKDIVSEYGMDTGKLVMKWRKPERIVAHIIAISETRARKGDAFRTA